MARKSETANSLPPSPANEEQVIAFLETHPDFLLHHPDLVGKLSVPSRFDGG
ncbi:MAG TPA: DUF484 family protein, partial [Rhodospirillaceae bacterium]|nr:DUF484 family protein [Rhodospirillaceae bacterium]